MEANYQGDKKEMDKIYFWPSAFCVVENDIWFVYGKVCVLCKYNIEKNETEVVAEIPCHNLLKVSLYKNIIYNNGRLFLVPCWGENILAFSICESSFEIIELEEFSSVKFVSAYMWENELICIPYEYPKILHIDLIDRKIKKIVDIRPVFLEDKVLFFNSATMLNDCIYMVSPQSGKLYMYDIKTFSISKIKAIDDDSKYGSITSCGNKLILSSDNENKFVIILDSSVIQTILWPDNIVCGVVWSMDDETFILDDVYSSKIWIYDSEFKREEFQSKPELESDLYCYFKSGVYNAFDKIYFNNSDMCFYKMDNHQLCKYIDKIEIKEKEYDKIMNIMQQSIKLDENFMINENRLYKLNHFLNSILMD